MRLKNVKSNSYALLVASVVILLTGTYTDNGGFQLAGGIILLVGLLLALGQATGRNAGD
jgi:hypothetical protein